MKRRRNCGIYKILNQNNGKFYIGSAVNLSTRWREHVWQLNKGLHINRHLQSSWKKHGESAFDFVVIERIDDEAKLIEREQSYLDEFRPFDPAIGYNLSPTAGSTLGVPCSPEKAAKIGAANRGRVRTEAHKAILRKYGGTAAYNADSRRKISEANIRRGAMTPELIRMGIEARRGKPLSDAHKAAQSAALKANQEHIAHLRALNAKVKGKSTILTPEQIAEMCSLRKQGMSYIQLGKKFGVSNVTAKNWCARSPDECTPSPDDAVWFHTDIQFSLL